MAAEELPSTQVECKMLMIAIILFIALFSDNLFVVVFVFLNDEKKAYGDVDATDVDLSSEFIWGRLVPHGGATALRLQKNGNTSDGEFNVFRIGRNANLVDLCTSVDPRISGQHCRLFCKQSLHGREDEFDVFIENLSGNNTFVRTVSNSSQFITLEKNKSRLLNSGDMISLLCPTRVTTDLLDIATYTFLREVLPNYSSGACSPPSHQVDNAAPAAGDSLAYSFTQAVKQNRDVSSVYDLEKHNELGRGQYGIVYKAIHRQ
jgi:hypothetical protein